jgi:aromatic-L-amino-acid/L-tryptophan decarboxylase
LLSKITQLEKIARQLEPGAAQREVLRDSVIEYAEEFLESLDSTHAYRQDAGSGAALIELPVSETPSEMRDLLALLKTEVDTPGLNPASGGHLGYIPGGGIYTAALGDYMADVTNRYAGVYFASPGAVRMENHLLRWMAREVGYPETFGGNLCSGGSMANLIALVAAREGMNIKARDIERSPIYLTEQIHHSVTKAIRIAGLGECPIHFVPMDAHFRMDANALQLRITQDRAAGLNPWLVVASAGTTDTGSIDPLTEIASISKREKIWMHIDAAYGGFFILTPEGREKLAGIGGSDSITMDPHKGLFLPYGSGAVLIKDREPLQRSHYYQANYMQDTINSTEEFSPADLSPELTKHFRGLRLWLPLMLHGLAPFRAALEEKLWLTRWFRAQVALIPGMEVGPEPDLSVTFFRLTRAGVDSNTLNEKLMKAIHADGRVFLSSTRIHGEVYIRFACLSFRTHLNTVEKTLKMIEECVGVV